MRTLVAIALAVPLAGCGLELLGTTAIRGGLEKENLKTMQKAMDKARGFKSDTELQSTVNAYYAENGQYPPSLEALVPEWLPSLPTQPDGSAYGYDPQTGRILDKPMPISQPGPSDYDKMAQIHAAILKYGQATGYYPRTLNDLVPQYLKTVPKTVSGQDFLYDMRTGALYHPNPEVMAQQQPSQPGPPPQRQMQQRGNRGPGVAGGGPLGEAMTGIAIQQELNGMSNAGASAAGSRARQRARGTGQNRNQDVNRQMDNLGL